MGRFGAALSDKSFLVLFFKKELLPSFGAHHMHIEKFGIAQPVRRVEDPRLLRGEGRYVDDFNPAGVLHGVVVRSPYAAARIGGIDTSAARDIAGVRAVYVAADLHNEGRVSIGCVIPMKNRNGTPRHNSPRPVLAIDEVRHAGDAVAFVVADTLAAARDAADAVMVEYDPLPAVADPAHAQDPGAPLVWPDAPNNVCFDWAIGDATQTDALFAAAAHITKLRVINNRVVVASMETRAALAEFHGDAFTLTTNTQGGWQIRGALAGALGIEERALRILTPDVGGGFGMKGFAYPEQVLVCHAARALGAPVKWTSQRGEAFLSDTHGRDNITDGELALDAEGKFLALRIHNLANMGGYLSQFGPLVPTMAATGVLAGVYGFAAIHAVVRGVYTHTVPVDAYRGAGRPESNYIVERLIDTAARELNIDRAELRRRNMVPSSAMPYTTPVGKIYDSGEFAYVLDQALARADWQGFAARRAESAARGQKRGIGLAYYLEATGGAPTERAEIRFAADGFVDVYVGTQSTGQGHETAYVMLTVERLGVPGEKVRVIQGDTGTIPTGGGTGGARSLYSEGTAIYATAATVIARGKQAAAEILQAAGETIDFADGIFTVAGSSRAVGILELAETQRARHAAGEDTVTLDATETIKLQAHTFPNGCHIAEVEIDPETGMVATLRYLVVDDVGRAINPMIVRGQVHGGVAQGLGQAILERTSYDSESGQLLAGSFMDYALPRAADLPDIEVELVEVPCGTNPLGVKGAGEAGAVGSPPALINAIVDALDGKLVDMPATPETVWRALRAA
jgi:carbon-monoxide dehydrogenase large subunit